MDQRSLVRAFAGVFAVALLAGCSGGDTSEKVRPTPIATTPATIDVVETESPQGADIDEATEDLNALADVFAERDQFMRDQQLPQDGSLLKATTPEQIEFIDAQRAHFESQGSEWNEGVEAVTLALTADSCETAILNGHEIDAGAVSSHIATSPLFEMLIPADVVGEDRALAEASVASIMVYGMRYMCPDDHPQWKAAFDELYPGHGGG
ncbi:MAG: hypothetical protein L0G23_02100 [Ruaniaceae bacterium]|nr:hypothetical protein [Ruaniaceae bacterium]